MKDYLNYEERTYLIIIMAMQETVEKFSQKPCLTSEEKRCLDKVVEWSKKFNVRIFDRLGEVLRRKIVGTMNQNNLRLVSKFGTEKAAISEAAQEDLSPAIGELQLFHCHDCEKCDYNKCAVYAISVACDLQETNTGDGCPFKRELKIDDFDDDLEEDSDL